MRKVANGIDKSLRNLKGPVSGSDCSLHLVIQSFTVVQLVQ